MVQKKKKNQWDVVAYFFTPKLIKKISVKSLESEPSWFQPINQGFEREGVGYFCIKDNHHTKKAILKNAWFFKNASLT